MPNTFQLEGIQQILAIFLLVKNESLDREIVGASLLEDDRASRLERDSSQARDARPLVQTRERLDTAETLARPVRIPFKPSSCRLRLLGCASSSDPVIVP